MTSVEPLVPILRRSVSDAVFEQLRDQILSGSRPPGAPLPSERVLCEALGVNRGSVREALRRLEQARLVSVRHGGTSQVLDYREHAGLDVLGHLVVAADGRVDTAVVRAIMEMRSAIAPDAARLAAGRRSPEQAVGLVAAARRMAAHERELGTLQERALGFWSLVIDASGNVAYRLAYNALRETYDRARDVLAAVLADELLDGARYIELAQAVESGDESAARDLAERIVRLGEGAVGLVLRRIEQQTEEKK